MSVTNEVVFQNVVAIALDIDVPTGKKSNISSDLRLQDVPPATLMSLGQKQTFDPALVVPLNSARKEAERGLLKSGVRFGGMILVPNDKATEALTDVRRVQSEFEACSQSLFAQYPASVKKWAEEAPFEWRHALVGAADSLDEIKRKTKFQYRVLRLSGIDGEASNNDVGESLVGQLYHEISVEAARTWRESLESKTELTHNIRRPFARFREKLSGLAFLNPSIGAVVQRIDDVMSSLPPKGEKIEGAVITAIQGLCLILSDERRIREFCEAAANGSAPPIAQTVLNLQPMSPTPEAAAPASNEPAIGKVEAEVLAPAPEEPPAPTPVVDHRSARRALVTGSFF